MTLGDLWDLCKAAAKGWLDDYAQSMGAALAYYTMFSIAPLLLIVISIAGLVFGDQAARGEIFGELEDLLGASGAMAVQGLLESVRRPAQSVAATVFGVALLLIGATSVFGELQDALDRIWRAPVRTGPSGIWGMVRARLLSFGMILGIGFLLMVSLVASTALAALRKWWGPMFNEWATLASFVEVLSSFVLVTVVFAMIYKIMPRVRIDWKDVWVGAAVTSVLFTIGKFMIGLYIGRSGIASGFGAAASLVVVLVWVYYSAQIFLLGAEFAWVYSHKFGSRKGLAAAAETAQPAPSARFAAPPDKVPPMSDSKPATPVLTPAQQFLNDLWDEHVRDEFATRDTVATLATMVPDAYVNHVPVMTGGTGREQLRAFYSRHFIPKMPPDTSITPVSRTIGEERLVDELIMRFTHTVEMDWMLPGVAPTGKAVVCAIVVVVHFRDGKLASEHIYWDQASVLVQVGLLDAAGLPVCGVEAAHKLTDPLVPSNALIRRAYGEGA